MKLIKPGNIKGTICASASKSIMQRAVAAGCLGQGRTVLYNPSLSEDGIASLRVSESLGAKIKVSEAEVEITGGGLPTGETLNCGESGLCLRLFTAISSLFPRSLTLEGKGSLRTRPLPGISSPLKSLGVEVTTKDGYPPVTVKGPMRGGNIIVDGSLSSQFISGLLMSLPMCEGNSVILVENLTSLPYIQMTLEVMRDFGVIALPSKNYSKFEIKGLQRYVPREYVIEGDWSGASFLLIAGATAGPVTVSGLKLNSFQGDTAVLDVLRSVGALIHAEKNHITVSPGTLNSFEFNAIDCPDLFPPLAVLGSFCKGISRIEGVSRLAHKESNRAEVLMSELKKIGIYLEIQNDTLLIQGSDIAGGKASSHGDHRIAMALSIAALRSKNGVTIDDPDCVKKSYPSFFQDLDSLRIPA